MASSMSNVKADLTSTMRFMPPIRSLMKRGARWLWVGSVVSVAELALVEEGPTQSLFTKPSERLTEDYITGRFG